MARNRAHMQMSSPTVQDTAMLEYVICVMDEDQFAGVYGRAFVFFAEIDKGISFMVIYHYFIGIKVGVECVYLARLSMCEYIAIK